MFSERGRSPAELDQLSQALAREYGWSDLRLSAADRGFYGETWIATSTQGRFFLKLIAYRRHMAGFLQSLEVVDWMNDMGLDFISRPVSTKTGERFILALDGVLAAFRFEEGLHTEAYPLEDLIRRMASAYRLPTRDLALPWERFGWHEYFGCMEALRIARASDRSAVKAALAVVDAQRSGLKWCEEMLRQVIPICQGLPAHRVITSGDVGGNVLVRDGELIVVDWDQLMLAPVERDLWFFMQDMHQIGRIDAVLAREGLSSRIEPAFLAYYACSRTFFYLREYLFSAMAEGGESAAEQLRAFFDPDEFIVRCLTEASRIVSELQRRHSTNEGK